MKTPHRLMLPRMHQTLRILPILEIVQPVPTLLQSFKKWVLIFIRRLQKECKSAPPCANRVVGIWIFQLEWHSSKKRASFQARWRRSLLCHHHYQMLLTCLLLLDQVMLNQQVKMMLSMLWMI
jgi:hypothetical protein